MAKDGTNRGGVRAGAGAKRKPLADKIADGNPGKHPLTVMEFKSAPDLRGQDMPEPKEMVKGGHFRGYSNGHLKRGYGNRMLRQPLTREQFCVMLYRYNQLRGSVNS